VVKSNLNKVLLGWLFLFAAVIPKANGDEPKLLNYEQAGFALTLPIGWNEIPTDVLKSFVEATSKLSGAARKQSYDFGYQSSSSSNWFDYPYILVQVGNTGLIPEEELAKLAKHDATLDQSVKGAQKSLPSIVSGVGVSETSFDNQTHTLRLLAQMNVAGAGEVALLSTIILTSRGTITIHCYARKREFETFRSAFESILNSVKLSDELRYRHVSRGSDGAQRILGYVLIGGLIGLLVGVVRWLFSGRPPRIRPTGA
jgi:hypothetical protein